MRRHDVLGIRTLAAIAADEADGGELFISIFLAAVVSLASWERTDDEVIDRAIAFAKKAIESLKHANQHSEDILDDA